jgi:hypothetical protein
MPSQPLPTFIIDCHTCKAKVAAEEHGRICISGGINPENGEEYYGCAVALGRCPKCRSILVGESQQVAIGGYDAYEDEWADPIRVYPDPPKAFRSARIPKIVTDSISEGLKSLQANANVAACVMFGRALEAICRDLLETTLQPGTSANTTPAKKRHIMLGEGIRKLKDKGLIDQRLLDWSQELHAFRNIAAHPTDITISREEAEDLRSFVFAIVEYIYDLTDRYNEFKERQSKKKQK